MRHTQITMTVLVGVCVFGSVGEAALGRGAQTPSAAPCLQCSEIVYSDTHGSVVITAPQGWTFDQGKASDQDLRAVLYPAGTTPAKALSVIHVKTVSREGRPTLGSLIAGDVERRRASSPGLKVESGDPLPTARESAAQVRRFCDANAFESVAYLETPAVYVTIMLSSKTEAAQSEGLPAFADLVKSYHLSTVGGGVVRE